MINGIDELESFFSSFENPFGVKCPREKRLKRMEIILDALSHPEEEYRTYHVAGSKGKGSVSAFLSSIIEGTGRKCCLYTSPHMFSVRERFMLPFSFFEDCLYIDTANELSSILDGFKLPDDLCPPIPTVFEIYTAYAYLLFKNYKATDAVIETGIGGSLDATNTITPEASIITPIELEHTDVLGCTLDRIAKEKAGIISKGKSVFVSYQEEEAMSVIEERAEKMNSPLFKLSDYLSSFSWDGCRMSGLLGGMEYSLPISMRTEQMAENAFLAILVADELSFLNDRGLENLSKVKLPGRFEEIILNDLPVVIDGAHTVNSARSAAISFCKRYPKGTLLFSATEGKNIRKMADEIFPMFENIVVTSINGYKKSNRDELLFVSGKRENIRYIPDPNTAFSVSVGMGLPLLITGSFYLPSEIDEIRNLYES